MRLLAHSSAKNYKLCNLGFLTSSQLRAWPARHRHPRGPGPAPQWCWDHRDGTRHRSPRLAQEINQVAHNYDQCCWSGFIVSGSASSISNESRSGSRVSMTKTKIKIQLKFFSFLFWSNMLGSQGRYPSPLSSSGKGRKQIHFILFQQALRNANQDSF